MLRFHVPKLFMKYYNPEISLIFPHLRPYGWLQLLLVNICSCTMIPTHESTGMHIQYITLHCKLHYTTLHYTKLNTTSHYTLHTTHSKLHTTHYTLHTIYYTIHTAHYTLHTKHYTIHITHYTLHTTH